MLKICIHILFDNISIDGKKYNLYVKIAWTLFILIALLDAPLLFFKKISEDLNIEQCVLAFGSFYFQSFHSGLRDSTFNIKNQAKIFSNLMDQFLSKN